MDINIIVRDTSLTPTYANPGDAGADLRAAESTVVDPHGTEAVKTGVSLAIPPGYVGFITPRSGLARRDGITVLNTPGTIDSGYRGELEVLIHNTRRIPFNVWQGDRIAQLVIVPFTAATFIPVAALDDTPRGTGGFGSTGR